MSSLQNCSEERLHLRSVSHSGGAKLINSKNSARNSGNIKYNFNEIMTSGEIINLQFGNFSNYVGAHWLNSQVGEFGADSEFDWNVLWRKPYSPRLVTVDFKSNYAHRRPIQPSKKEEEVETHWEGEVEKCETEEDDVGKDTWNNLVKWQCQNIFLPNSAGNSVEHYSEGRFLFTSVEEELDDAVRTYAEECDRLQGLHILSDVDGFGGLTGGMLQLLSDDYEKKTLISFALAGQALSNSDFRRRTMNSALLVNSLNQHSSVFSYLSCFQSIFQQPLLQKEIPSLFQQGGESQYLGVTLDTLTAPYCLKRGDVTQLDVAGFLNAHGRKLTAVAAAIPFSTEKSLFETLNDNGMPVTTLVPNVEIDISNSFSNFIVPRGFTNIIPKEMEKKQIGTAKSCLQLYAEETWSKSVNVVAPVHTSTQNCGCLVTAHNTGDAGNFLESLVAEATNKRTMKVSKAVLTKCDVMEVDDYDECLHDLHSLLENYK